MYTWGQLYYVCFLSSSSVITNSPKSSLSTSSFKLPQNSIHHDFNLPRITASLLSTSWETYTVLPCDISYITIHYTEQAPVILYKQGNAFIFVQPLLLNRTSPFFHPHFFISHAYSRVGWLD